MDWLDLALNIGHLEEVKIKKLSALLIDYAYTPLNLTAMCSLDTVFFGAIPMIWQHLKKEEKKTKKQENIRFKVLEMEQIK